MTRAAMPVPQLRSLRPALFMVGAGLLAYAGCSSGSTVTPAVTHPTLVEVAPALFQGSVPCVKDGSGFKRYVATLFDAGLNGEGGAGGEPDEAVAAGSSAGGAGGQQKGEFPDPAGFRLASSLPTPCGASVGFGYVVPTRRYEVRIEGYDTEDLDPRASGSREMVLKSAEDPKPLVSPRWFAKCDRATAVESTIIRADQCTPFQLERGLATSLRVRVGALLGSVSCGTDAGQVDELSVTLTIGGQTIEQTASCSPEAEVVFDDLAAGEVASLYVSARAAGVPLAGAVCRTTTVEGTRVEATCPRLSTLATLRVELPAALAQLGLTCGADVSNVEVDVTGVDELFQFPPPDCLQPFEHALAPGQATATLTVTSASSQQSLLCHAELEPGKLTVADCDPAE